MLIGVSGKIGSGKDTIGKIIQYLVWKSRVEKGELPLSVYSFSDFARETSFGKNQSGFEIKKYADKLKDFVCMLIGCTREQLEDQDFKNKELPEEWDVYVTMSKHSNLELQVNNYPSTFLIKEEAEKVAKEFGLRVVLKKMTYREFFQKLGTEAMRNRLHENVWVNALFADYKELEFPLYNEGKTVRQKFTPHGSNWIITDVRFDNELEAVKKRGGISIRVNRPWVDKNKEHQVITEHLSETTLDNAEFDYTIENNSTIEDLIHTVSLILKKEKII